MYTINPAGLGPCLMVAALGVGLALPGGAEAQAQTRLSAQPARPATAEVTSLCNPQMTQSSSRGGRTTYSCEGKKPTPRPGASSVKAAGGGGTRAKIDCSYSESGGAMKWLGCTCTADDDGNCTNFITWCAEQGDEVSGNSGGASCSPGG